MPELAGPELEGPEPEVPELDVGGRCAPLVVGAAVELGGEGSVLRRTDRRSLVVGPCSALLVDGQPGLGPVDGTDASGALDIGGGTCAGPLRGVPKPGADGDDPGTGARGAVPVTAGPSGGAGREVTSW